MQKSESIKELAAALTKFQAKQIVVGKDAVNPYFKSKYATLSHIQESIAATLSECGLSYVQLPEGTNGLTTMLLHESGEWISCTGQMTPTKSDPQGQASAITYQRRYGLVSILGLNVGDQDDDGNAASKTNGKTKQITDKQVQNLIEQVEKGGVDYINAKIKPLNITLTQGQLSMVEESIQDSELTKQLVASLIQV